MKQMILLYLLLVSASLFAACSGGSTAAKLDANSMSIDTMGLPYSWQANRVEATAYDNSQPPGAMGLPEHIQVNFGVTDPADVQFGDPILYIIPVEEYKQLWDEAGNTAVSNNLNNLESILKDKPDLNTASLSALPYEAYVSIGAVISPLLRKKNTSIRLGAVLFVMWPDPCRVLMSSSTTAWLTSPKD
jgi:hypothetical protein